MAGQFLRAVGLMSGTSLDGVDAAWIETDGVTVARTGMSVTLKYQDDLRADLRHLLEIAPGLGPDDAFLRDVEHRLTLDHCIAAAMIGDGTDIIGMHGQTILHVPDHRRNHPEHPRTWQIGDAAMLARKLNLPVVHDFRSADVAAGGQGAPLAPLYHAALAEKLAKPLAIVNIGGVANITYLGADGSILSCDTGPGNGPLDDLVFRHTGQAYDKDGLLAAVGTVQQDRLARLMSHPYFALPAPKSLDRLTFSRLIAAATDDLVAADAAATLTAFTVAAIAAAPVPSPSRVLVCGGGRHNHAIMAGLRAAFDVKVEPVEAVGWDGDALEAQCFGFLAVRSLYGLPLSLPSTTGVPSPITGGRLVEP
jgi:anhydro-N-acetylmuramic acid kinase